MQTGWLELALAFLIAASAWRGGRWYWRPRLRLPEKPVVEAVEGELRFQLDVSNDGAARSRDCRLRLLHLERREGERWVRLRPLERPEEEGRTEAPGRSIPARSSARIELETALPASPGEYRIEVAVINGEERRASYVIQVE